MRIPNLPALTPTSDRSQMRLRIRQGGECHEVRCGPAGKYETLSNAIDRLVEWRDAGFRWPPPDTLKRSAPLKPSDGPSLGEIFADYLDEHFPDPADRSNVANTARCAARLLLSSRPRASMPAEHFGALELEAWMREVGNSTHHNGKPFTITTISDYRRVIHRVYAHAVKTRKLDVACADLLATANNLRPGQTAARPRKKITPVDDLSIALTIARVHPLHGDMILFLRLTGCRSGEAKRMRGAEISRAGRVWQYRPATHKTQHVGKDRVVEIGPAAQRILSPYLDDDPDGLVFKSPTGAPFGKSALRQAIARACKHWKIPTWTPHQLRHSMLTEVRARFGLEHGSAIAGHSRLETTQIYAERDHRLASSVAAQIG